jgi:hypothetical protein
MSTKVPEFLYGILLDKEMLDKYVIKEQHKSFEREFVSRELSQHFVGQRNYAAWKVLLDVYDIFITNGATLFGGCVRDYIRRTHAADTFYKYREDDWDYNPNLNYNNRDMLPDTYIDRTCLPKDVDAIIDEENVENLKRALVEKLGFVIKADERTVPIETYFLCNVDSDIRQYINHQKFTLELPEKSAMQTILYAMIGRGSRRLLREMSVKVDLIIRKTGWRDLDASTRLKIHPPFGRPDFQCNLVSMTGVCDSYGCVTRTIQSLLDDMSITDITSDITKRIAKLVQNDVAPPRHIAL